MNIIIHRVNSVAQLATISPKFGVEIDLRAMGNRILLNHEPFADGEDFEDYLREYHHGTLVLNIKEAGIENRVEALVKKYGISDYFFLDVEFPYIYRSTREGNRAIAMRYSEDESIENVLKYQDKLDWVWIDTNTRLPLDTKIVQKLQGMKTCLVCPERWGRPEDIPLYRRQMRELGFTPTAVMTALSCVEKWISPEQ